MKKTLHWVKEEKGKWEIKEKITCEVTGEMDNHRKVWTQLEDGEHILDNQFFVLKVRKEYYFIEC